MRELAYMDGYMSKEAQKPLLDMAQGVVTPLVRGKASTKAVDPVESAKKDPLAAAHAAAELSEVGMLGASAANQHIRRPYQAARAIAAARGMPFPRDAATRYMAGAAKNWRPHMPHLAKHLNLMSGLKNHSSKAFFGTGAQRAVGPLWAAVMAADAAKTMGQDPSTKKWGFNVPSNISAHTKATQHRMEEGGAGAGKQVLRGVGEGISRPLNTIINAGVSVPQTAVNNMQGASKLGIADHLRTVFNQGTSPITDQDVKKERSRKAGAKHMQEGVDRRKAQRASSAKAKSRMRNKEGSDQLGFWWMHLQKHAENPNHIPDGIEKYDRPEGQEHDPKCAVPDSQRQPLKPGVSDPKDSER